MALTLLANGFLVLSLPRPEESSNLQAIAATPLSCRCHGQAQVPGGQKRSQSAHEASTALDPELSLTLK